MDVVQVGIGVALVLVSFVSFFFGKDKLAAICMGAAILYAIIVS